MTERSHVGTSGGQVPACVIETPDGNETRVFEDDHGQNEFIATGVDMVSFDAGPIRQNGLETFMSLAGDSEAVIFTDY
jgi:hypothetical protein